MDFTLQPNIKLEDVRFAILDTFYVHEDFEKAMDRAFDNLTTNVFADPAFTFPIKLASSILTCIEGPISFIGAVTPFMVDAFAEKHENKLLLVQTVEQIAISQEMHTSMIEKGITVSKTYNSLRKLQDFPSRICSQLENAHRDLFPIILHFSSKNLRYRSNPTLISQMMLAIAPVSAVIGRTLPYLEEETDMNCRLRAIYLKTFSQNFCTIDCSKSMCLLQICLL